MKRKIMMITAVVVLFVGVFVFIYNRFNSNQGRYAVNLQAENQLTTATLGAYLSTSPGKHVFYLDDGSSDAQYISTSLLIPLGLEFEGALPDIEPIELTDNKMSVIGIKKTYQVESLPAFVIVETNSEDGAYTIIDSLSYDKEKPFDIKDLRDWFHDNNLWNAPYASTN